MLDNQNLRIIYNINKYRNLLYTNDNIIGFGRGTKIINDKTTNEPCLTIFVKEKLSKDKLSSCNIIPQKFNGVTTDILIRKQSFFTKDQYLPAIDGDTIYNISSTGTGTLGCTVTNKGSKENLYILSNNHVLCYPLNSNKKDDIYMRRISARGLPAHRRIAVLDQVCPINIDTNAVNEIDAALALVGKNTKEIQDTRVKPNEHIPVGVAKWDTIKIGDIIHKTGAATGYTTGKVITVNVSSILTQKGIGSKFVNLIDVDIPSNFGDSGSLGLTNEKLGMGLITAQCEIINHDKSISKGATFCSLEKALNYFGVVPASPAFKD